VLSRDTETSRLYRRQRARRGRTRRAYLRTQELDTGLRSGLLTTALSTAASRDSGVAELADYINNGYIYAILMVISLLNLDRF